MQIVCAKSYDDMSHKAAALLGAQILLKPAAVLGLATGSSPIGTYQRLKEACQNGDLDFSQITSVNLDEYVGLGPDNDQSYRYFMNANLFNHVNIARENTFVPSGLATNAEAECARYEDLITALGGVDMQLLGLGANGHIGFNEPDTAFARRTHKVALTKSTIKANRRFFEREEDVPRFAYTMGIGTIMQARRIVVIAAGAGKAEVVKNAVTGPITPQLPASILQLHQNVTLVADEAALSLL